MIRRIVTGVGANIFDKLAVSITQLLMVPVFASHWGLHLYGLWALLFTIPSFLAMGDFGFGTAAGIKMRMSVSRGDHKQAICTFQSAWIAILICSACLVGAAVSISLFIPIGVFGSDLGMHPSELRLAFLFLMLYGIAILQQSIFFAGLRCDGFFALGAASHGGIVLVECSAAIATVLGGGGPVSAAAAMCAGRLSGVIALTLLLRSQVPWLPIGFRDANRKEVQSLLVPAGGVMLLPLANALYLQGSAIALGTAVGQAAVPAFTATRTLSRLGLQICLMVNTAMMPEFSTMSARGDRHGQAAMVIITFVISIAIIMPVALVLAVAGRPMVALWTNGVIAPQQGLLISMAVSTLAIGLWYPLSNLMLAMNKHGRYTLIFAALSLLGIPITFALSREIGSAGAGVTMALIDLTMLMVVFSLIKERVVKLTEVRAAIPLIFSELRRVARSLRQPGSSS